MDRPVIVRECEPPPSAHRHTASHCSLFQSTACETWETTFTHSHPETGAFESCSKPSGWQNPRRSTTHIQTNKLVTAPLLCAECTAGHSSCTYRTLQPVPYLQRRTRIHCAAPRALYSIVWIPGSRRQPLPSNSATKSRRASAEAAAAYIASSPALLLLLDNLLYYFFLSCAFFFFFYCDDEASQQICSFPFK